MIPRYSRPEMTRIWEPATRFRIWFEIEAHACDAQADLGVIPREAAEAVWTAKDVEFDIARIDEIERETRHDVIAFLTHLAEHVGDQARFVHQGMTSSDVLDTCFNIQLVRAADILLEDLDTLLAALKKRAFEHKDTVTIGRSHGIHAEPTTFGLKLAQAYAEFARNRTRLEAAREDVATCAISGAVGTFANIDPSVEAHVAAKMGLAPEPVSTQVIPRDRHAFFFATLGVIASSVERLATEIRHLQRTELREAEEYFAPGQKGSSAMPHKRNPVLTENLTGLARLVRAAVIPAMENVALWHERDISHSSVERNIGPDATVTLDFALARLTGVVEKLLVYPDRMMEIVDQTGGLIHSQRVLLALTQAGVSREDAYRLVQRNAMKVWEQGADFREELLADQEVTAALGDA
ncbi:MAG: adenylosuccinate lyase, partial [Pseudomonadota bacterium]